MRLKSLYAGVVRKSEEIETLNVRLDGGCLAGEAGTELLLVRYSLQRSPHWALPGVFAKYVTHLGLHFGSLVSVRNPTHRNNIPLTFTH